VSIHDLPPSLPYISCFKEAGRRRHGVVYGRLDSSWRSIGRVRGMLTVWRRTNYSSGIEWMILYDDCIDSSRLKYRNQCITHTLTVLTVDCYGRPCVGEAYEAARRLQPANVGTILT